jgi:hypothetical protein
MATIKERACEELGWDEARVAERLYFHCLTWRHRLMARLLWPFRERLFSEDLRVMERVVNFDSYNDVWVLARDFAYPHRAAYFWRDTMGIRPRGRRLLQLAKELLVEPTRPRSVGSNRGGKEKSEPPQKPGLGPEV